MTYKDAQRIAHGLIHGYISPDDRVMDKPSFFCALAAAIRTEAAAPIRAILTIIYALPLLAAPL